MIDLMQMIISGIAVGSSYALMGLGMVLIYKSSAVPNFVQGEMALLPVFIAYMIIDTYGYPVHVAFAGALAFAVLLGERKGPGKRQGTQRYRADYHHHRYGNDAFGAGILEIRGGAADHAVSHFLL